jgi:outer membrane protein OmpA-like peptidoglycan-associated protein
MREIIGLLVGILGFLLLSSQVVKRYGVQPASSPQGARSYSRSPSIPPAPSASSTSPSNASLAVEETPFSHQSARPPFSPVPRQEKPIEGLPADVTSHTPTVQPPGTNRPEKVIQFQSGCVGLSRKDRTTLSTVIPVLQRSPRRRVAIDGHTDDTGNKKFNQDLSRLRADVVRYYFADRGIDATRITVRGYGSSSPIADNRSPSGRRLNRRTEITFSQDTPAKN